MHDDDHDPRPRRDPWWLLAFGIVLLVLVLWLLLERSNSPEPGAVKEGRMGAAGYSNDSAARRASSSTGSG